MTGKRMRICTVSVYLDPPLAESIAFVFVEMSSVVSDPGSTQNYFNNTRLLPELRRPKSREERWTLHYFASPRNWIASNNGNQPGRETQHRPARQVEGALTSYVFIPPVFCSPPRPSCFVCCLSRTLCHPWKVCQSKEPTLPVGWVSRHRWCPHCRL